MRFIYRSYQSNIIPRYSLVHIISYQLLHILLRNSVTKNRIKNKHALINFPTLDCQNNYRKKFYYLYIPNYITSLFN